MATKRPNDSTRAPSSGQVAGVPPKASVSAGIKSGVERCDLVFQRLIHSLDALKHRATKIPIPMIIGDKEVFPREAFTVSEAVCILSHAPPPEDIEAQRLILSEWAERNEEFLQDSIWIKGKLVKVEMPEDATVLEIGRRSRESRVRDHILETLGGIDFILADMMSITGARDRVNLEKWLGHAPDYELKELKLQPKAKDLGRYIKILLLLTEMVGDQGSTEESSCADVKDLDKKVSDEGLKGERSAEESACPDSERHHDRDQTRGSGKKGHLKVLMRLLRVVLKRPSKKRPSKRNV